MLEKHSIFVEKFQKDSQSNEEQPHDGIANALEIYTVVIHVTQV